MSVPYDEQRRPGDEPLDPWAEDETRRAQEAAAAEDRWVSESGGMGPIPSRTWTRGGSRVTLGGCCLPLPIGCPVLVATAGLGVVHAARRR